LVCVVGRVGTGKSSFLLGLINEIRQTYGRTVLGGTVSYVPQQAWVQSGTIRENILFGSDPSDADLNRVNMIIEACGLEPDISQWQDGDLYVL
jgi:ATP-binding cassette subfamily C (CFTR/MRP) protein 1